ncbi:MAG: hypothetical protein CR991_00800 [Proteobacteria bacterium]|nr:MAG: hypothetical protein CR991_00800 [Pseudomonadota bacterium]
MLQIQFEGSEQELREYIKKHRFVSSRIILLVDNTEETKRPELHSKKRQSIRNTPAFGMWASRKDMEDVNSYVRSLRQPRSFE